MNHFTHRIIRGLPLITVDPFLKQGCFAAYTTREGGVSPPPYDSLNLSFSPTRKDSRENVEKNWSIVLQALDCFPQQLIRTHQTHSNRIAYVNHPGQSFFPDIPSGVDGVVTDRHELMLTVVTADCQGLLFYDPKKKISAAIHSGWRGALADIGGKAVCKMAAMGSDPADILVAGGPSIGTCCFEVGEDVLSLFQEQWGSDALAYFTPGDAKGKYMGDMPSFTRNRLLKQGIQPEHIYWMSLCTCCHDVFFSHRRQKGERGTLAALIIMKG